MPSVIPTGGSGSGGGRLSFSLQGLAQQQPPAPPSFSPDTSAAQLPALALTNAFARPADALSSDATRLNTVIDDLTQRLRKTTDRIQHLENANARTSQSFASAKTHAAQQISALKAELATVVTSEAKLRTELGAKPKVAETKSEPFLSCVRSALEADELEQRAVAAEQRCATLAERHAQLSADVELMEGRREQMVSAIASAPDSASAADLEGVIVKAKRAARKLERLENRRAALEDEVTKFDALAASRREDAAAARREAALVSAKIEEGEANLSAVRQRAQAAGVAEQEATRAVEAAWKRMPVLPNVVSGADCGSRLNSIADTSMARVEMAARTAVGVPFHFDMDAPIALGAASSNAPPPEQNAMIKAVVGDLTAYFQDAVRHSTSLKAGVDAEAAAPLALAAA